MRYLFVHQNMPGQFKHMAARLALNPDNEVVFITQREKIGIPGVKKVKYKPSRTVQQSSHHYMTQFENCILAGQEVVRATLGLVKSGFVPDIVISHPGWGETMFMKEVLPRTPLLHYCEYYYNSTGSDVDESVSSDVDKRCKLVARNAHLLLSLDVCDHGYSPTNWQKIQHPKDYHHKIDVVFDGIDTDVLRPNPKATFTLPNGRVLTAEDEVVTYVSRNLEPYRGYPTFVRAVPKILEKRPNATVVVVGGDGTSYGPGPGDGKTWRQVMDAEVPLDPERVHFMGQLPYNTYLNLLQISSAHIYLTVPFVLSWSMMEALSVGCAIVCSATPPVLECVEDGVNGLLVDFNSPDQVAERTADLLANQTAYASIRQRARETVLERYALVRCLPQQMAIINNVLAR